MKNITLLILSLFVSVSLTAQDIQFTFANAQITNDGANDYYEVDVFIGTVNSTGSFKLGSGQLYFNYSAAAFGTNISANNAIEVITDFDQGYIAGQPIDLVPSIIIYGGYTLNDNTETRVSWAFSQTFSSSTFAADNVAETPVKLCKLKIKYADSNQDPMLTFEEGDNFDDQFFTACGPVGGGATDTADCGGEPGTQITNDSFDSTGASLSTDEFMLQTGISIYPTVTKDIVNIRGDASQIDALKIYSISGRQVIGYRHNANEINLTNLSSGIYLIKLQAEDLEGTFKVVKE